jgi:23S rRNA pseudouridine1911/1915/1917 synthase
MAATLGVVLDCFYNSHYFFAIVSFLDTNLMSDRFRVSEASLLMPFLKTQLQGWTGNKIKERLKGGCVVVNDEHVTKHNLELNVGDQVEVLASGKNISRGIEKLEILYSERGIIAVNKPAGLLSVSNADETKQTALAIVRKQISTKRKPMKLWAVNRLDRETSGVVLFTTSQELREAIMDEWYKAEKTYLAIVEGQPEEKNATIDTPLRMDPVKYLQHVGEHPEAKRAITHYKTDRNEAKRSLLTVKLDTGRQHQIRAHLSSIGHPVVGDARYGTKGPRLGLHSLRLSIMRPKTQERLTFETPAPNDFYALLK